jgi:hypothetical protein
MLAGREIYARRSRSRSADRVVSLDPVEDLLEAAHHDPLRKEGL